MQNIKQHDLIENRHQENQFASEGKDLIKYELIYMCKTKNHPKSLQISQ